LSLNRKVSGITIEEEKTGMILKKVLRGVRGGGEDEGRHLALP